MKKIFLTLLAALVTVAAAAQVTVTGLVADSTDGTPVPYATVRLYDGAPGATPATVAITGEDGRFAATLKAKQGVTLIVSFIGMQPATRTLAQTKGAVDAGTISLAPANEALAAATVTAARPVVRMETDKVTYDMQADPDTKSATLLDMLRKVPLVTVDGNDNIQVAGQSNFKIYVDGKPQPMFNSQNASLVMKSIPASYATEIEVITNPGARYDAEGTGGILNIKTTMAASGAAGAASGGAQSLDGYSLSLQTQLSTRGQGGGANYTLQRGRFSLSLGGSLNHQRMNGATIDYERTQHLAAGDATTLLTNRGDAINNFAQGNLSMSYKIDSLRLLTASGTLMSFHQHQDGHGQSSLTQNGTSLNAYSQTAAQRMNYTSWSANLDYQRGFASSPERFFTLSYQLSHTPFRQRNSTLYDDITGSFYTLTGSFYTLTDRRTDDHTWSTEHTAQADFTTPLAAAHKLSVGGKFIGRINKSQSTLAYFDGTAFALQPADGTDYHHYNDIGAAYAEYEGKAGPLSLKAGLRYEHTWQRVRYHDTPAKNFSLDYGNLVPSASLTYQLAPTQSVGLSYGMRITRPGITALNPYVNRADATAIEYGNTNLDAERTNNLGLVFNSFSSKFIVRAEATLALTTKSIEQYSFYDAEGVLNSTYGNVASRQNAGFNLFLNYRPTPLTSLMVNGGANYVRFHSGALQQRNHGWQGRLMVGVQQTLWWKLKLSANLFTMTRQKELQGYRTGFSGVMGSLTRSFFKGDLLTVGIMGFTPLTGTKIEFRSVTRSSDFTNRMKVRVPVGQIGVSLSLRLGAMGVRTQSVNRSIENNDVETASPQSQSTVGGMTGGMGM
ncbi:MAG: TonB-dependent receptor [Bacteroidaceae bacterium]|nr:TonB-dependent receptor [Bacteroidaceae bacterium]